MYFKQNTSRVPRPLYLLLDFSHLLYKLELLWLAICDNFSLCSLTLDFAVVLNERGFKS